MAEMIERARKRLAKRAKKGFRGWPIATVALYGPDDTMATKLTVGIVPAEDAEVTDLRRWLSEDQTDIRGDIRVTGEVLAFITEAGAKSVAMTDRIIGCPHEEGVNAGARLHRFPEQRCINDADENAVEPGLVWRASGWGQIVFGRVGVVAA
jgi:hypothetical protein